jgi:2-(3-amino-3-carboxypropyl)histidine synthase
MHAETIEEALEILKQVNAKKILVQFPEGLRGKLTDIYSSIEKAGLEPIVCMEATWGACDVRLNEAKVLQCDAILHIGHEDFGVKVDLPVVYVPYYHCVDAVEILKKEFSKLEKFSKIGLVASLQFVKALPNVKKFLEENGKKVFLYRSEQHEGQILGCRVAAATAIAENIDCFLCITAGKFYPLGVALETEKPVFSLDMEKQIITDMSAEKRKVQKIVAWNREKFAEAKNVGILISWKLGQFRLPSVLKEKIERKGKKVYLLAFDEITPEKIDGFQLDFLVNTACPRIGTDDYARYKIPILTYTDLLPILEK